MPTGHPILIVGQSRKHCALPLFIRLPKSAAQPSLTYKIRDSGFSENHCLFSSVLFCLFVCNKNSRIRACSLTVQDYFHQTDQRQKTLRDLFQALGTSHESCAVSSSHTDNLQYYQSWILEGRSAWITDTASCRVHLAIPVTAD